ncbi:MAG TPA: hypothetical protein VNL92_07475, partial [Dehalococcoidia bacterium]|nr:hypothetical protein [Dehalococcoidia bacterium]
MTWPSGPSATRRRTVRVALDVMGGDRPPEERVRGGLAALDDEDIELILVGVPDVVEQALREHDISRRSVRVVPSGPAIPEGTSPVSVLRERADAAVAVATRLVKAGEADAVASAGNTGASMASAQVILGTLPGVDRVAAGGPIFGPLAPQTVLLDGGANVDVRPHQLVAFGVLGAGYVREAFQIENPTVALLANGAERGKGNKQVREAYPLFEASGLNFIGQIEGYDLLGGRANVVICDGFVGNILVKFWEVVVQAVVRYAIAEAGELVPPASAQRMVEAAHAISGELTVRGGPL